MRKAPKPQRNGTRKAGTMNMQKPVAMPRGGITIFLRVTALRPSRTRQASTPARPMRETRAVMRGVECMRFTARFLYVILLQILLGATARLRFGVQFAESS